MSKGVDLVQRFGLVLAGWLLLCGAAEPSTQAAEARSVPVADFFRQPALQAPTLSPDGKRIAMIVPGPNGRTVLALADVETPSRRVGVAHFDDADIRHVWWVNDQRLAFDAIDYQSAAGEQFGAGLYAVDIDGRNFVWLVGRGRDFESGGHAAIRPLRWNHRMSGTLRDGSDDVLVTRLNVYDSAKDAGSQSMLRLNTRTKATRALVLHEPRFAAEWATNPKGEALSVRSIDPDGQAQVQWRPDVAAAWTELARYDLFRADADADALLPLAVAGDGQLLVRATRNDEARTSALYLCDPRQRKRAEQPLIALAGFDFDGDLIFDRVGGALVGASYTSDAAGVVWLEPGLRDVQKRVDELLPHTANVYTCDPCGGQRRFIVTAWSDRQPPVYFLFDREGQGKAALALVGPSRPAIDAARAAVQDFKRIPSRDGRQIPVYVTQPRGKGPWPTVVLVHGGPWVRGTSWGWNAESQFLASRGYLVVEPEFRGSLGYGDAWFRASFKQWGQAMQDDVTDATRWVIAQGLADPQRIAIAGASYGGYAAMMGLVREPELYRAAINWVGVTDVELMYSIGWSDFAGGLWQREGMPRMVGDPDKDRTQLRATSPLRRAAEIDRPVLMAYGGRDRRVPMPHGTGMRDALLKSGKAEVEWVEYELEGHGFLLEANRVDFWGRVERFLAKHLR